MSDSSNNPAQRYVEHDFANSAELAEALAQDVAGRLHAAIAARGHALLALSGGTTPLQFMRALSGQPVDWARVIVTLCDERWVPPQHERSNARLIGETLLHGAASAARFVPLYVDAPDPESGLAQAAARIAALPLPIDAAVLGLGLDGHTASLFPDGDRIDAALDADGSALVLPMRSPSAGEPRITLTLPVLVAARALYMHIEGCEKKQVFARNVKGEDASPRNPLRALLQHSGVALVVYWCD
ncbi:MAG TPA: 6-phosphogluconolactonase [Rhodanobacteraceae bacterium]|nr:6-phosphogluconolactonase [Rhodanobacteraceae bacterium]